MEIELKGLITWSVALATTLSVFFHLKGRVSVLEATVVLQREQYDRDMDRITDQLMRIDRKLDALANKL